MQRDKASGRGKPGEGNSSISLSVSLPTLDNEDGTHGEPRDSRYPGEQSELGSWLESCYCSGPKAGVGDGDGLCGWRLKTAECDLMKAANRQDSGLGGVSSACRRFGKEFLATLLSLAGRNKTPG